MLRLISFAHVVFALMLLLPSTLVAQDANSILRRAVEAYEGSNGIEAAFTITTTTPSNGGEDVVEGTINIKGDKFTLVTADMRTWFDGTTQWSYVERNEEVNVTTPSGDELLFTNPILLLKNYNRGFSAKYVGESTAKGGKSVHDIELTPKRRADVLKVELRIEKFSSMPLSIRIFSKNGMDSRIEIGKVKRGVNQPDSLFSFNPDDYPDADVIDLR